MSDIDLVVQALGTGALAGAAAGTSAVMKSAVQSLWGGLRWLVGQRDPKVNAALDSIEAGDTSAAKRPELTDALRALSVEDLTRLATAARTILEDQSTNRIGEQSINLSGSTIGDNSPVITAGRDVKYETSPSRG